ncbi:hypothetical protein D9757_008175 [Collybiopsis confluens]|uniref:Uncharacterized protein n=1 Tax=Collybiopsis confluens TaxID=2823264 RepID=A0A8H5M5D5_9AGAR|nr:hypothetical protein D9757_008175 [Collybiopsis confluens]
MKKKQYMLVELTRTVHHNLQVSETLIVDFYISNMSILPGLYKIRNEKTSHYIASYSTDRPGDIVRTLSKEENSTLPAFNFEIKPLDGGRFTVTSILTHLHIGIAAGIDDGVPLLWAGEPEPVSFIPADTGIENHYAIRIPPGPLPVERYCYEKDNAREVAVTRNIQEVGGLWILERVD